MPMSRSRVIAIVSLMSLSLLGLVLLQVHWVRSAITLKEQEFDKNVFDAMYETVLEHQRSVMAKRMKSIVRMDKDAEHHLLIINGDTIHLPQPHTGASHLDHMARQMDAFIDEQEAAIIRGSIPWEEDATAHYPTAPWMRTPPEALTANPEWYAEVLNSIAGELPLMMGGTPDQNVDLEELGALLDRKLRKRGIDLQYDLAVNRIGSPNIMTVSNRDSKEDLVTSEYRANLFPNQLISEPTFLYVHFPKKFGFLLSTMWIRLGTSVILILLIIGCFGFVTWTILRQKKLSDMKTDFINNMTHEFKTPIATLSLAGQAIGDTDLVKDQDRLSRFGHVILEESGKLGTHVERILQMAQIDKDELRLSRESVDMHDVIRRLVANYQLRLQGDSGSLVTNLTAGHSAVYGDPVHLSNMIDNLLDNAVKYSKPGQVAVTVATRQEGGKLVVRVEDQGIGMKRDTVKRIFDRFYRAGHGNVHDVKGFGLGLSYVKYVVDAHQGEIDVRSEPGHGSIFEVTLPLA